MGKKINQSPVWKASSQQSIPCHKCDEKFQSEKALHNHLTNHFWRRFLITSESTHGKDEDSTQIPSESSQFPQFEGDPELENAKSIDAPHGAVPPVLDVRIKHPDIAPDDDLNIYEPKEQVMKDLEDRLILSFSIDYNIYCLVCRGTIRNCLQYIYEHFRSIIHSINLEKMIEDHWKSQADPDEVSDLAFAHQYTERFPLCGVKCYACGIFMTDDYTILHHMEDPSHIENCSFLRAKSVELFNTIFSIMTPNFYNSQKYWCVPCEMIWTVEMEFREHLRTKQHEENIEPFKNEIMMFDYCAPCATLWYGFLKTFNYHSTCKMHNYQIFNNFSVVYKIPHPAEKFLHEAESKIEEILADADIRDAYDKEEEDLLIRDLERICKERYPSVNVHSVGSKITGLGGKKLEIFINCSGELQDSTHEQALLLLESILKCLQEDVETWRINWVAHNSRVPRIKATHKPTGKKCGLSFNNGSTVVHTLMIKAYCERYPDCRKLIFFVKNWMKHCEIARELMFTGYGITWLVIYFLQVKMILPTVSDLIQKRGESRIIGGWETGVCTDFEVCDDNESFRELVTQFFKFYGGFDYRNEVICPLVGKSIEKRDFQRPEALPVVMKPYLDYLQAEEGSEAFRVDTVMCLQNPFDLAHNLCKAVPKFMVHRFKTLCCLSARVLDDNADPLRLL